MCLVINFFTFYFSCFENPNSKRQILSWHNPDSGEWLWTRLDLCFEPFSETKKTKPTKQKTNLFPPIVAGRSKNGSRNELAVGPNQHVWLRRRKSRKKKLSKSCILSVELFLFTICIFFISHFFILWMQTTSLKFPRNENLCSTWVLYSPPEYKNKIETKNWKQ